MREIKFRVWNGEKMLCYGLFDVPKNISYEGPPMQFTGLLDKQGKEIFEGDIMAIKGIDDDQEYYYEVRQNNAGTWMACNELYYDLEDKDFERCFVYSNICENPELLNK